MSNDKLTKDELAALGQTLLERRERQAQAQARRRKKLKEAGFTTLNLSVPSSRIDEIKKIISFASRVKKGLTLCLCVVDESGSFKPVSEKVLIKE